jgi:hypothetical protein
LFSRWEKHTKNSIFSIDTHLSLSKFKFRMAHRKIARGVFLTLLLLQHSGLSV